MRRLVFFQCAEAFFRFFLFVFMCLQRMFQSGSFFVGSPLLFLQNAFFSSVSKSCVHSLSRDCFSVSSACTVSFSAFCAPFFIFPCVYLLLHIGHTVFYETDVSSLAVRACTGLSVFLFGLAPLRFRFCETGFGFLCGAFLFRQFLLPKQQGFTQGTDRLFRLHLGQLLLCLFQAFQENFCLGLFGSQIFCCCTPVFMQNTPFVPRFFPLCRVFSLLSRKCRIRVRLSCTRLSRGGISAAS